MEGADIAPSGQWRSPSAAKISGPDDRDDTDGATMGSGLGSPQAQAESSPRRAARCVGVRPTRAATAGGASWTRGTEAHRAGHQWRLNKPSPALGPRGRALVAKVCATATATAATVRRRHRRRPPPTPPRPWSKRPKRRRPPSHEARAPTRPRARPRSAHLGPAGGRTGGAPGASARGSVGASARGRSCTSSEPDAPNTARGETKIAARRVASHRMRRARARGASGRPRQSRRPSSHGVEGRGTTGSGDSPTAPPQGVHIDLLPSNRAQRRPHSGRRQVSRLPRPSSPHKKVLIPQPRRHENLLVVYGECPQFHAITSHVMW